MRLWRPDSLAARFALLLTAALMVATMVAVWLLSFERTRLEDRARAEAALARVLAAAPLMDGAAPAERRRLAESLSRRGVRVRLGLAPSVDRAEVGPVARRLIARLEPALEGRDLRLTLARDGLRLSVRLDTPSSWLNAVLRTRSPPPRDGAASALVLLGLSLAATLAVGLVFVRQLSRPLAALAAAARAAGRGYRTARVPETGAREVREAAVAFNAMQARIARYEAERMRMLAALGHDLRTPIASLRIRAEMLEEVGGDAAAEAQAMGATLADMAVMADGLVAYARGVAEAEAPETLDLAAWLGRVAAGRGAAVGPLAPLSIRVRPVALGRAVGNLIDNALRYAGGAAVTLARDDAEIVIAVEDEGPGIPAEQLEEMTEPFRRGEASRNAATGGAGLGLAVARAVAEGHGGAVRLSNRPTGGLRAELRLAQSGVA